MKKLTVTGLVLVVGIISFFVLAFAVNRTDVELNPAIQAAVTRDLTPDALEKLDSYKQLQATEDRLSDQWKKADFSSASDQLRCVNEACAMAEYLENRVTYQKDLNDYAVFIAEFDTILKGPGIFNDHVGPMWDKTRISSTSFMRLTRFSMLSTYDLMASNKLTEANSRIINLHRLLVDYLKQKNQTTIEALVTVTLLSQLRDFVQLNNLGKDLPSVLAPIDIDFESLIANIEATEITIFAKTLQDPSNTAYSDMAGPDLYSKTMGTVLGSKFIQTNRTLNKLYDHEIKQLQADCVRDTTECPNTFANTDLSFWDYIQNSGGNFFTRLVVARDSGRRYKKLFGHIQKLRNDQPASS